MSVCVVGQKAFGVQVAESLGPKVSFLASPPDDGLRALAELHNVGWCDWGKLRSDMPPVDLIVTAHCDVKIGRSVRRRATLGAIGYHPSLLPLLRGSDSIRWAIHEGYKITGGTVFKLDDGWDTGDIISQQWCFVRPGDTALDLWKRDLAPMGLRLLGDVVYAGLKYGILDGRPQDDSLATVRRRWRDRDLVIGESPGDEPIARRLF